MHYFQNLILCPVIFFSQLFALWFFYNQKAGKDKLLDREHQNICFMFHNIFFHKNTMGECETPSLFQKEKLGLQNLIFRKCYFQA